MLHHKGSFLNFFGISEHSNWIVKTGFVLSKIIQPMFIHEKIVDFILLNDLEKYLLNENIPILPEGTDIPILPEGTDIPILPEGTGITIAESKMKNG